MAPHLVHFTEEQVASCNGETDREAGINDRTGELCVHTSDHNEDSKVQSKDASDSDDTGGDNHENSSTDYSDASDSEHHSSPSPHQPSPPPPRSSAPDLSTLRTHLNGLHAIPPRPPFLPQPTHPPPTTPFTVIGRGTAGTVSAIPGTVEFDKASLIDYRDWKECCRQMVTAVTANDPYFPNPVRRSREERALWGVFEAVYVKATNILIGIDGRLELAHREKMAGELLGRFVEAWKERAREQRDTEDGGFVEFG